MPGSENSTEVPSFYYVYVLQSINRPAQLYVGYSSDLRKRIKEHNAGRTFSTKSYMPWQLIHFKGYKNKIDAQRRERYLKMSQGARLLKRMLKEFFYANR